MRVPRSAGGAIAIFMLRMEIPRFALHVAVAAAIHSHQPWRRHEIRRNGRVCIARAPALYFRSLRLRRAPLTKGALLQKVYVALSSRAQRGTCFCMFGRDATPRDARSKTPPWQAATVSVDAGAEVSRRGHRHFHAAHGNPKDLLFTLTSRRRFIRISRGDGTRFVVMERSALRGPRLCTSNPRGFAAPPYQGGYAPERAHCHPTAIHSYSPWRRHKVRRTRRSALRGHRHSGSHP